MDQKMKGDVLDELGKERNITFTPLESNMVKDVSTREPVPPMANKYNFGLDIVFKI